MTSSSTARKFLSDLVEGNGQWAISRATTANASLKHHQKRNVNTNRYTIYNIRIYMFAVLNRANIVRMHTATFIQFKMTASRWMQTNFSAKCKQCVCAWQIAYGFNVVWTSGIHPICNSTPFYCTHTHDDHGLPYIYTSMNMQSPIQYFRYLAI